ncbi:sensor histidine kinase [Neobacillus sp. PS2-9]|uniref:sensor histidine kinase n=1 Tax=Neobacillus sp. PS2-9 TaxID=3070676 RepID=UPI0027E112EB|nr:sensor histidine kinase [Neobacillus sp. PS2-9]WML58948.1 sensor histidine kinase [Neobacillus sp. PS2-9]
MMKPFLIERRSWIALFIVFQGLFLFVASIDSAIPFTPILYMVFLSSIIFILFLFLRYQRETKFFKGLEEWENDLDLLTSANSPFEKMIEETLTNQTKRLKQEASQNQMTLEEEKDDLLAWIHEVKTPLTAMHLMLEHMNDEPLKTKLTYEWLRIHHLLDQQLHQRRIPFMENDLYIEQTDLKSIIFTEIRGLQSWCMQKRIGFDVDLQVPSVLSDSKWLAFIVRQLLTNAVKYSEASDIIITSCEKIGQTILEIQDFGRGIAPKDLPRIFEKGFTSTINHHDNKATGMGLYLAKKASKPLLITMEVQSTLGKGSTFTLRFPKRNDFNNIIGM